MSLEELIVIEDLRFSEQIGGTNYCRFLLVVPGDNWRFLFVLVYFYNLLSYLYQLSIIHHFHLPLGILLLVKQKV